MTAGRPPVLVLYDRRGPFKICPKCKKDLPLTFFAAADVGASPEAHHPDYSDPYTFVWVCKRCHAYIHRSD